MQRVLRTAMTVLLAGVFLLAVPGRGQAALPPNDSVFFYKSGLAVTGTIHNGVFTQDQTITENMSGWTAGAMSRDTLVLLNATANQLLFASLRAGNYAFTTDSIFITGGFTKVTASCDSVLFYSPSTGRAGSAALAGGNLDFKHAHSYTVGKNFTSVNASCNTVTFLNSKGTGIIGTLKGGVFTKKGTIKTGLSSPVVAHTATSFVRLSKSASQIEWGTSQNGVEHRTNGPNAEVAPVTHLAGTSDSVLSYDSATGQGGTAELVNGKLTNPQQQSFSSGWQIIVGGR